MRVLYFTLIIFILSSSFAYCLDDNIIICKALYNATVLYNGEYSSSADKETSGLTTTYLGLGEEKAYYKSTSVYQEDYQHDLMLMHMSEDYYLYLEAYPEQLIFHAFFPASKTIVTMKATSLLNNNYGLLLNYQCKSLKRVE